MTESESILAVNDCLLNMDLDRVLHVSISSAKCTLHDGESCEIRVIVENTGDSRVTLLKWGSPLDRISPMLGIFEVQDTETNKSVETPMMKVSRKLPPPEEDLIEIESGESAEEVVKFLPSVPSSGQSCSIQAKGWWQAVWALSKQEVVSRHLQEISEGSSGSFSSNSIVISRVRLLGMIRLSMTKMSADCIPTRIGRRRLTLNGYIDPGVAN
jgi:hypothetical protein